jgi:AraC-like DNA-binding protein
VKPAIDSTDFLQRPIGRYLATPTWIAFCAHEAVSGFVLWGSPTAEDVIQLMKVVAVDGSPLASPMARWVDMRRLEPSAGPFSVLARHFAVNAKQFEKIVTRAAVIYSGELAKALIAGLGQVMATPYTLSMFTDPTEAVSWLGLEGFFVRELDEIQASTIGTLPFLRDLRAWLSVRLRDASLQGAVLAMKTSQRSLQRHLSEHGTSFQRELRAQRVLVAKELLRSGNAPISVIAYEVGCASTQSFGRLFREVTGSTPSEWRAGDRESPPNIAQERVRGASGSLIGVRSPGRRIFEK